MHALFQILAPGGLTYQHFRLNNVRPYLRGCWNIYYNERWWCCPKCFLDYVIMSESEIRRRNYSTFCKRIQRSLINDKVLHLSCSYSLFTNHCFVTAIHFQLENSSRVLENDAIVHILRVSRWLSKVITSTAASPSVASSFSILLSQFCYWRHFERTYSASYSFSIVVAASTCKVLVCMLYA